MSVTQLPRVECTAKPCGSKARAGLGRAGGTGQPELVDMPEDPLAQGAEQPATARFRTQVGIAQANHVGMLLQADEPQYPRVPWRRSTNQRW